MKIDSLEKLFFHELGDMISAEKQIVKALPKMIRNATSQKLKEALQDHLDVTQEQVGRVEQVFKQLGHAPKSIRCKGMEGLLEEGSEFLEEAEDPDVIDAGIIGAAQRVEHYEIAVYGTLCAYAKELGHTEVLALLQQNLEEEKQADETLTEIAEASINSAAAAGMESSEEEEEGEEEEETAGKKR